MGEARWSSYLRIHPHGIRGRLALYGALVRSAVQKRRDPTGFQSVGHQLRRPIEVRPFGLRIVLRPRCDDLIYAMADHKPSTARWFRPGPGEQVVEVGTHLGLYSLRAGQLGASVLAIEPNPVLFDLLSQNVARNGLSRVRTRNVAAGRTRTEGLLLDPGGSSGVGSLVPGWSDQFRTSVARAIRVPVLPLDEILAEAGVDRVDWLMIDAEGYEAEILAGASSTLPRTQRVIIEVAGTPNGIACEGALQRAGLTIREREAQNAVNSYWYATRG